MVIPTSGQTQALPAEGIYHGGRLRRNLKLVWPEENRPITGPSNKVVALPDGSTIQATHTAILPFESLSDEARKADVLPGLRPNSLVSVGKLADAFNRNTSTYDLLRPTTAYDTTTACEGST